MRYTTVLEIPFLVLNRLIHPTGRFLGISPALEDVHLLQELQLLECMDEIAGAMRWCVQSLSIVALNGSVSMDSSYHCTSDFHQKLFVHYRSALTPEQGLRLFIENSNRSSFDRASMSWSITWRLKCLPLLIGPRPKLATGSRFWNHGSRSTTVRVQAQARADIIARKVALVEEESFATSHVS